MAQPTPVGRAALRIAAASALLTVCSAGVWVVAAGQSSTPVPRAADGWRVILTLSGGFAGVDRRLDVSSTGELSAADRGRGASVSRLATAPELAEIGMLAASVKPPASSRRPTNCRDCFEYALEIERGGERFATKFDDTNLPASGFAPLVNALTTLLNRALPPN
jgi:hypothetical protein